MLKECELLLLSSNHQSHILYSEGLDAFATRESVAMAYQDNYNRYDSKKGYCFQPINYHEAFEKKFEHKELYILSDIPPKNGELVATEKHGIWEFKDESGMGSAPLPYWANKNTCKKILASTNEYLWKLNIPKIPNDYLRHYFQMNGLIKTCMVEYNDSSPLLDWRGIVLSRPFC